ncbi:hypothetical protein CXG81DRAFT_25476 [Caulochytrium protostelioides]|uniref:Exocyst complex component EXOC2/Sec5 N-terminal domain-containing protein n=1 Tax=Caulochytrium protostelioides TaxID=1555241 RepID=A0A4P9X937_9FUNG|nr:hypothetical protein CXG81DRAFT_25476 [Caulochytrium protostelioides]|eukprot:RKP01843.1 hypothetical protein CXG81DRAFT_25476 [Caulochytrium protostelioides]
MAAARASDHPDDDASSDDGRAATGGAVTPSPDRRRGASTGTGQTGSMSAAANARAAQQAAAASWTLDEQQEVLRFYDLVELYPTVYHETAVPDVSMVAPPAAAAVAAAAAAGAAPSTPAAAAAAAGAAPHAAKWATMATARAAQEPPQETADPLGIKASVVYRPRRRPKFQSMLGLESAPPSGAATTTAPADGTAPPAAAEDAPPPSVYISHRHFDPSFFLREIHRGTSFRDLENGLVFLKKALVQRQETMKQLVKTHFAQFVHAKATIDAFYTGMRERNLVSDPHYGLRPFQTELDATLGRARTLYGPMLERRQQAEKIRVVLTVLDQWKFFFNLPSALAEMVARNRYDAAVRDYQKGRHLMTTSFPGSSAAAAAAASSAGGGTGGTPSSQTPAAGAAAAAGAGGLLPSQYETVFARVWTKVEKVVDGFRQKLFRQLEQGHLPLDMQEKLLAHLVELDSTIDPFTFLLSLQFRQLQPAIDRCIRIYVMQVQALAARAYRYGAPASAAASAAAAAAAAPPGSHSTAQTASTTAGATRGDAPEPRPLGKNLFKRPAGETLSSEQDLTLGSVYFKNLEHSMGHLVVSDPTATDGGAPGAAAGGDTGGDGGDGASVPTAASRAGPGVTDGGMAATGAMGAGPAWRDGIGIGIGDGTPLNVTAHQPFNLAAFCRALLLLAHPSRHADFEHLARDDLNFQIGRAMTLLVKQVCQIITERIPAFWKICCLFLDHRADRRHGGPSGTHGSGGGASGAPGGSGGMSGGMSGGGRGRHTGALPPSTGPPRRAGYGAAPGGAPRDPLIAAFGATASERTIVEGLLHQIGALLSRTFSHIYFLEMDAATLAEKAAQADIMTSLGVGGVGGVGGVSSSPAAAAADLSAAGAADGVDSGRAVDGFGADLGIASLGMGLSAAAAANPIPLLAARLFDGQTLTACAVFTSQVRTLLRTVDTIAAIGMRLDNRPVMDDLLSGTVARIQRRLVDALGHCWKSESFQLVMAEDWIVTPVIAAETPRGAYGSGGALADLLGDGGGRGGPSARLGGSHVLRIATRFHTLVQRSIEAMVPPRSPLATYASGTLHDAVEQTLAASVERVLDGMVHLAQTVTAQAQTHAVAGLTGVDAVALAPRADAGSAAGPSSTAPAAAAAAAAAAASAARHGGLAPAGDVVLVKARTLRILLDRLDDTQEALRNTNGLTASSVLPDGYGGVGAGSADAKMIRMGGAGAAGGSGAVVLTGTTPADLLSRRLILILTNLSLLHERIIPMLWRQWYDSRLGFATRRQAMSAMSRSGLQRSRHGVHRDNNDGVLHERDNDDDEDDDEGTAGAAAATRRAADDGGANDDDDDDDETAPTSTPLCQRLLRTTRHLQMTLSQNVLSQKRTALVQMIQSGLLRSGLNLVGPLCPVAVLPFSHGVVTTFVGLLVQCTPLASPPIVLRFVCSLVETLLDDLLSAVQAIDALSTHGFCLVMLQVDWILETLVPPLRDLRGHGPDVALDAGLRHSRLDLGPDDRAAAAARGSRLARAGGRGSADPLADAVIAWIRDVVYAGVIEIQTACEAILLPESRVAATAPPSASPSAGGAARPVVRSHVLAQAKATLGAAHAANRLQYACFQTLFGHLQPADGL